MAGKCKKTDFCNPMYKHFGFIFHAWSGGFWTESGSENLDPNPDQAWNWRRLYCSGTQTLLEMVFSSRKWEDVVRKRLHWGLSADWCCEGKIHMTHIFQEHKLELQFLLYTLKIWG